jgi:nuclear transport factor 2 (NTF2) superfamily protein
LDEWNSQDVDRVVSVYTADVTYVDPDTTVGVKGEDALRRYLTKLFARWKMHRTLWEVFLFDGKGGCAVLWHDTFQKAEGGTTVETDGMDLVVVRGDRIERNEVYFDRAVLAPLLELGSS